MSHRRSLALTFCLALLACAPTTRDSGDDLGAGGHESNAGRCGDLACGTGEDTTSCALDCAADVRCAAEKCAAKADACRADARCLKLFACLAPCQDSGCARTCANHAGHDAVVTFNAWNGCAQDNGCRHPGEGDSPGAHYCDDHCNYPSRPESDCRCDDLTLHYGSGCFGDASKGPMDLKACAGSTCRYCNPDGTAFCGDKVCQENETAESCPGDCA